MIQHFDEALARLRHYVETRDRVPMRDLADEVHVVHGGDDRAALSLSDLRVVVIHTAPPPPSPIAGRPSDADLLWLCRHPRHSLVMVEIEGGFVPLIVDERGAGPIVPEAAP